MRMSKLKLLIFLIIIGSQVQTLNLKNKGLAILNSFYSKLMAAYVINDGSQPDQLTVKRQDNVNSETNYPFFYSYNWKEYIKISEFTSKTNVVKKEYTFLKDGKKTELAKINWLLEMINANSLHCSLNTDYVKLAVTYYPILPPAVCVIDDGSQPDQLTVKWQDTNDNETNYRVERSADGAAWAWRADAGADSSSHNDTTTAADHTYQYRIRAEKNGASSSWCYTVVVDLSTGNFKFEGVKMEGVKID